jgi:ubiquinone/menaquinone biosynthesis C-methylase UbiE
MGTTFLQLISELSPDDVENFFILADEFPEKTPQVWQRIAAQLKGRYTPPRLEGIFASLCAYFEEPSTTTTLSKRVLYELPISRTQLTRFPFMNLGYHASPDGPPIQKLELKEEDRKFRCNMALYQLWLERADVEGRDVVEVGSGRGAGGSFLSRYYKPRSYIGVDGCRQQVILCNDIYPALKFVYGHASSLPLDDASADLLINVESSQCYPDLEKFFSEVQRVLRKGGTFVLTDILFGKSKIFPYLNLLDRYFHVKDRADITRNVVACLEAHGPEQFLGVQKDMPVMASARIFLPMDISPFSNYRALAVDDSLYVSFLCQKRN